MEDYSGKLNIRIPKSLHRILVEKAKEEKVSLNQYINYQLSRGVGYKIRFKLNVTCLMPRKTRGNFFVEKKNCKFIPLKEDYWKISRIVSTKCNDLSKIGKCI